VVSFLVAKGADIDVTEKVGPPVGSSPVVLYSTNEPHILDTGRAMRACDGLRTGRRRYRAGAAGSVPRFERDGQGTVLIQLILYGGQELI
jgi:hypothetical protein